MPHSRKTKLFENGKPVRSLQIFPRAGGKTVTRLARVVSGILPRKIPAPSVSNRIQLSVQGVDVDATSLTGGAIRLLSHKKGISIFRKQLREGTVTFQKDDVDVLAVYKKLGAKGFSTQT